MYVILLYIYLVPQKCKFVNSMPIYCTSSLVPVYKKQSDVLILQFILVTYKKEKPTRQTKHQSILTKKREKTIAVHLGQGSKCKKKNLKNNYNSLRPVSNYKKKMNCKIIFVVHFANLGGS